MEPNNYIELNAEKIPEWDVLFWKGFYPAENPDAEITNYEDKRGI